MKTNVSKWGNSLALRIPAHIAAELKLIDGTEVELKVEESRLLVKRTLKSWSLEELLDGVTRDNIHRDPWGGNAKE